MSGYVAKPIPVTSSFRGFRRFWGRFFHDPPNDFSPWFALVGLFNRNGFFRTFLGVVLCRVGVNAGGHAKCLLEKVVTARIGWERHKDFGSLAVRNFFQSFQVLDLQQFIVRISGMNSAIDPADLLGLARL